jgi:NAD(P)-dependent dehydrogenase (short-subunit alcohol dehydrogenase family)
VGRLDTAEEVAAMVAYLTPDASAYIAGQALVIGGIAI